MAPEGEGSPIAGRVRGVLWGIRASAGSYTWSCEGIPYGVAPILMGVAAPLAEKGPAVRELGAASAPIEVTAARFRAPESSPHAEGAAGEGAVVSFGDSGKGEAVLRRGVSTSVGAPGSTTGMVRLTLDKSDSRHRRTGGAVDTMSSVVIDSASRLEGGTCMYWFTCHAVVAWARRIVDCSRRKISAGLWR